MGRALPQRLYCSQLSRDETGQFIGTCGSFLPGRTPDECERLAAAWGWQVQPQVLCPSHRAMAGRPRLVVDLALPPPGPRWGSEARADLRELGTRLPPAMAGPMGCEALVRQAADQEAAVAEAKLRGGDR